MDGKCVVVVVGVVVVVVVVDVVGKWASLAQAQAGLSAIAGRIDGTSFAVDVVPVSHVAAFGTVVVVVVVVVDDVATAAVESIEMASAFASVGYSE